MHTFYTESIKNYDFVTEENWKELGPKRKGESGQLGQGPVEFITIFDTGTVASTRHMLTGSLLGGLFYSDDYGESWNSTGTGTEWAQSGVISAVFHPQNYNIWFAASSGNELSGSSIMIGLTGGIYRTKDKGVTWEQIGNKDNLGGIYTIIYKILIDPINPNVLFAATSSGIFRTANCNALLPGQVAWTRVYTAFTYDIEMKPDNNQVLYATGQHGDSWKVLKSSDNGLNFSAMTKQPIDLPFPPTYNEVQGQLAAVHLTIEVSKAKPGYLYSLSRSLSTQNKFFTLNTVSPNNNWTSFHEFTDRYTFGWGHAFGVEQVVDGDEVLTAFDTKMKKIKVSTGEAVVVDPVHADLEDFAYHPYNQGEVWSATHGGVEKRPQFNQPWQPKYEGLGVAQVQKFATSYTEPKHIVTGLYHDGAQVTRTEYNKDNWNPVWYWDPKYYIDGEQPLIDNKSANHTWCSGQYGRWFYSDNYLTTSTRIFNISTYFGTNGVLNKLNTEVLYVNKYILYGVKKEEVCQLSNRGLGSQKFISTFHLMYPDYSENIILGLYTSDRNPDYLYVILLTRTSSESVYRLMRTTNVNATNVQWHELKTPRNDARAIFEGLDIDHDNPNIIYLTYTRSINDSVSAYGNGLIYKVDYSNSITNPIFSSLTKNLPYTFIRKNSVAIEKNSNHGIYLATEFGVFYTNDTFLQESGNEWKLVGKKLPHTGSHGIEINYPSNTIRTATWGRGVWEIDLPCIKSQPDYLITQNTTFSTDRRFDRNIIVKTGKTLTINDGAYIYMPEAGKIIVEPGAKLLIDQATITSGCSGMWEGIEVWGNSSQHQFVYGNNQYYQGYVNLNDATLSNARNAISLWKPGDYSKTGGIVIATNSSFINNRESIRALFFRNFHPINGSEMDYIANFINCTFTLNEDFLGDFHEFYRHVDLCCVKGVKFYGCDFSISGDVIGVNQFNQAIAVFSAGVHVRPITLSDQSFDVCSFTGFHTAIYCSDPDKKMNPNYFNGANFINNHIGINLNTVFSPIVINSEFYIAQNRFSSEPCSYGIYSNSSSLLAFEENKFHKYPGSPAADYFGIAVLNCNSMPKIYKNEFYGLSAGNYAYGKNWDAEPRQGLEYLCNFNSGNFADFYVDAKDGDLSHSVQTFQGSQVLASGNKFSADATHNFYNGCEYSIGYYHCGTCPNETPVTYTYVTPYGTAPSNTCPSHYGGEGSPIDKVVLTDQQRQELELEFALADENFNSVNSLYTSLIDGGSTENELSLIERAGVDDMMLVRSKLLGDSPHLSQDVLKLVADRTDVFPDIAIFDILANNPDELKNEELLRYLENKENPLPDYMIEILREVASGTTYKTVLYQEMTKYQHQRNGAAGDIIRSILNDTIVEIGLLRDWLDNLGGFESDKAIIGTYIKESDFENALLLADLLPSMHNLQGDELESYNDFVSLIELESILHDEQRTWYDLTQNELQIINEIAENNESSEGARAQSILESFYDKRFHNCQTLTGGSSYKKGELGQNWKSEIYGFNVIVSPNPAKDWVVIEYELPFGQETARLSITNSLGRTVEDVLISGQRGEKVIATEKFCSGVYVYTITSGEIVKSGKIVVAK